jgi:UPF0176 protein
MPFVVSTFYAFIDLPDYAEKAAQLREHARNTGLRGSILLAGEGVNATIAGTRGEIDALFAFIKLDSRFARLNSKESFTDVLPFKRMKVRLKKEIVTFGVPEANPARQVGRYVKPEDWNELIRDPDVLVIDVRNRYEVSLGSFKGALNPETASFRQFPEFVQSKLKAGKHTKIATFCTGGIRCEKATSYLVKEGFQSVYHLEGGILKYLESVPEDQSLWEGKCFVFDERVALDHELQPFNSQPSVTD